MRYAIVVATTGMILAGCARLNSIQRDVDLSNHSITLDAEQRVVISNRPPNVSNRVVICAEPSPDVLKVRATNVAGILDKGDSKAIELALSQAEAGQNIGLRTQSIQLLRDAMYRACEGAASGLITGGEFNELQTRFQKLTAVLLATEQLTGAVQPRSSAVLVAGGSAGTGSGLLQIQEQLEKAAVAEKDAKSEVERQKEVVAPLQQSLEDAKKTNDKAAIAAADEALKEPARQLAEATTTLQERKANREALELQRDAARSAGVSASPSAIVVASGEPPRQLAPESVKTIARSINTMVKSVFDQDSVAQRCFRAYVDLNSRRESANDAIRQAAQADPVIGKEVSALASTADSVGKPNIDVLRMEELYKGRGGKNETARVGALNAFRLLEEANTWERRLDEFCGKAKAT
ncbi:MAG: hypothetical protein J0M16_05890 [Gammaproteobacteria bacterium]|nr:hypothetical protein [Gammaproteobacteria bacterium]